MRLVWRMRNFLSLVLECENHYQRKKRCVAVLVGAISVEATPAHIETFNNSLTAWSSARAFPHRLKLELAGVPTECVGYMWRYIVRVTNRKIDPLVQLKAISVGQSCNMNNRALCWGSASPSLRQQVSWVNIGHAQTTYCYLKWSSYDRWPRGWIIVVASRKGDRKKRKLKRRYS